MSHAWGSPLDRGPLRSKSLHPSPWQSPSDLEDIYFLASEGGEKFLYAWDPVRAYRGR